MSITYYAMSMFRFVRYAVMCKTNVKVPAIDCRRFDYERYGLQFGCNSAGWNFLVQVGYLRCEITARVTVADREVEHVPCRIEICVLYTCRP